MYPTAKAKLGTPLSIMLRKATVSCRLIGSPSTKMSIPPIARMFNPVAVMMMSASSSSPEPSKSPLSVKVSIVSVTIEAVRGAAP